MDTATSPGWPDMVFPATDKEQSYSNMVEWIQQRIKITGYNSSLWKGAHSTTAIDFLSNPSRTSLFVSVDTVSNTLIVCQNKPPLPSAGIRDIAFFVRHEGCDIDPSNISTVVQFGTFAMKQTPASVLKIMEKVFYPHIFHCREWNESTRKELMYLYHRFMASLTESSNEAAGKTTLYLPLLNSEPLPDVEAAPLDRELVQQLESIVIHWTRQIKAVLNNRDDTIDSDLSGPMEEIKFWRCRAENLAGISKQLLSDDVRHIVAILKKSKSAYLAPFEALTIEESSKEADDNLKFLEILTTPCEKLVTMEPDHLPSILPHLMNCARLICSQSTFYNTKERIVGLLRKISNEIIRQCRNHISLDGVFSGDVNASMGSLKHSTNCCIEWKNIYKRTAVCINNEPSGGKRQKKKNVVKWDFDETTIFAQVDAFIQRCCELLEVCNGRIQFVRSSLLVSPKFGGTGGAQIMKSLSDIEQAYKGQVEQLQKVNYDILNVRTSQWHKDFNIYKNAVKELDVMYTNVINSALEPIRKVDTAIDLLEVFFSLAKRDTICHCIEKRANVIRALFVQHCQDTRQEFDNYRREPPLRINEPQYAGSALWARSLSMKITNTWNLVKSSTVTITQKDDEAEKAYASLVSALNAFQHQRHQDWLETLESCDLSTLKIRLDQPLLKKVTSNDHVRKNQHINNLICNFEGDLLILFTEVHFWEKIHIDEFDIPHAILGICHQREELRVLRERMNIMVRAYNELLDDLAENESRLFSDYLRQLDKKIRPGLSKLLWSSRPAIVERYAKVCVEQIHEIHILVKSFHARMNAVRQECHYIGSFPLIQIDRNATYNDGHFEKHQEEQRRIAVQTFETAHSKIKLHVEKMFGIFQECSDDVSREWKKLLQSIDLHVLEALRKASRMSLQRLSSAINGNNSAVEPQTLFHVRVVLKGNSVECRPTLIDLTHVVNTVAKDLINTVRSMPQIQDVLERGEHYCSSTGKDSTTDSNTNNDYFYSEISADENVLKTIVQIMNGMASTAADVRKRILCWDRYKLLWEMDKESFIRRYAKANRPLECFERDIIRYKNQQASIEEEESNCTVGFIKLDTYFLKVSLASHCTEWQEKLTTLLSKNAGQLLNELVMMFDSNTKKMTRQPRNLPALQELIDLRAMLKKDLSSIGEKFAPIEATYRSLANFDVQIGDEIKDKLDNLLPKFGDFKDALSSSEAMIDKCKVKMRNELNVSISKHCEEITKLRSDVETTLALITPELTTDDAFSKIASLQSKVERQRVKERELQPGLDLFGIDLPDDKELADSEGEIELMKNIWTIAADWEICWQKYREESIRSLDVEKMETFANTFTKNIAKLRRAIGSWPIWKNLRERVEQFKQLLPLVQDLRNEGLRDRHWNALRKTIGRSFEFSPDSFSLNDAFSLGFQHHSNTIAELSANASKELGMERTLNEIESRWAEMDVDIVAYKDTFKIRSTDDLFATLEDDNVSLSTMKASKYYGSFQEKIDDWENTLSLISEVIESILMVQRKWMYLESIFMTSGDISKQLPREHDIFLRVNNDFKAMMKRAYADSLAKQICCRDPKILMNICDMDDKLEKIQKSLDQYLETKRMSFPRFYFVSDDDLLEILGKSRDPVQIQKHVKKCFEGVQTMKLLSSGGKHVVSGVISPDGEELTFASNIALEGPIELLFVELLKSVKVAVQYALSGCVRGLKKEKKEKWVKEWHGQLIITAGAVAWTSSCMNALAIISSGRDRHALRAVKKKQVSYLRRLTNLVRDPKFQKLDRLKTVALITMEIHNRDVIERLVKSGCSDHQDFAWLSQLRFFFDKEEGTYGTCYVRQTNCKLPYSNEYQGNNGRLVVTPLTDRCVLTLLTAMFLCRGGNPLGPAGTGKTETVKDLSKNLAQYCVVSNCSDGMDYKSVGRIFSGLCQAGCWGCFDEFNRIKIEVISVVAMQVLSIFNAQRSKQATFSFMGTIIPCSPETGIFITMNPGYAGRTELPDNLKALMRPVAMMTPDLNLIAEVMLAAEGFNEARVLAKKTITLYSLMQQQLSKQDHYDYGLRNLKAVLNMAGKLKRDDASMDEELILMKALRDMNLPKFINEDLKLFQLLLGDLFPDKALPISTTGCLQNAIDEEFDRSGLQKLEFLKEKIMQLHDSQQTRHCNMLVGGTQSGKSTAWKTLVSAKVHLARQGSGSDFRVVDTFVINPKSVTLSELYGSYDLQTFEWSDGILSKIFKQCAESDNPDEKWLIFDGPIDALWIESMNSVMDDNKLLTLINGDRIPLTDLMSLLFEVEDLAVASPATVSRAGMVYIDASDMGWKPFVKSWLAKRHSTSPEENNILEGLFDKYVEKVLHFKKVACKEPVPVTDCNAVQSLVALFDAMTTPENGFNKTEAESTSFPRIVEKWFVFCLVWSVMGSVDEKGRVSLDHFLRDIDPQVPPIQSIYEYFVKPSQREFELWETKVPKWSSTRQISFHKIVIPTVDTIRNTFVVTALWKEGHQILIGGNTGSGKTILAQSILSKTPEDQSSLTINFSSTTSSATVQAVIEGAMEKRSKNKIGPSGGKKKMTIFIDDFNMPRKTSTESPFQPPLELIRLWLDYDGWYDREKCSWRYVSDSQVITAMAPPSGGREVISNRTQSRFCLLHCTQPNDEQIVRIFQSILSPKLNNFHHDIKSMAGDIVKATLAVYKKVSNDFLTTPAKSHYLFNLRDIAKVVQGILQGDCTFIDTKDSMLRLWAHECMRSFSDRFLQDANNDEAHFIGIMKEILNGHFGTDWNSLMEDSIDSEHGPIFTSFIREQLNGIRPYAEITSKEALLSSLTEQLEDYNTEPKFVPMNLVLFDDALRHICRIHRVLCHHRGNMMLIGIGGSGRQSLTRLASFIAEIEVFTIEITKQYRCTEFHEDLKKMYIQCGVENKSLVFLLNDGQINNDSFYWEDVNNMLSSGEVPNLFIKEELVAIYDGVRKDALSDGQEETPESLWAFFIERVRANLHIILTMSPIGETLRSRCRMFPSLVNCTHIDWFNTWPMEALRQVASKYLSDSGFGKEDQGSIAETFAEIHLSVIKSSEKMKMELKRFNYVTPTNYLELVKGYLQLLKEKRIDLGSQKSKLSNGLQKLEDSREQVETMRGELEEKKLIVEQSQHDCEKMLEVIVSERKVAEEQKKSVEADSERIGKEEKECQKIASEAEADLAIALPALEAAMKEVDKLDKSSITEIKAYSKPPPAVEKVLSCVMILMGKPTDWSNAKKTLGDTNFLSNLKNFDKDNVREATISKVKKFVSNPSFSAEETTKVSKAAGALCSWCHAIHIYANVAKEVAPKRASLKAAQKSLAVKQEALSRAKEALANVVAKVSQLKEKYDLSVGEKNRLKQEANDLEDKLNRAEKLISGLSGEYTRWTESVGLLEKSVTDVTGDALVAAGFLSYAAPFDTAYRESLIQGWVSYIRERKIPLSAGFNFSEFLSDPTDVREWNIQGLPKDSFSTENGVIVKRCARWPLMIDPQGQANKWIRAMEGEKLKVIDLNMKDILRDLESAIMYGMPVLLQDIMEDLDASLEPVLNKSITKVGNRSVIKLGDKEIDYNESFRFYITTNMGNPHYTPEVSTKTTVINFAVKEQGLEAQLLGIVVNQEQPSLEKQKSDLTVRVAAGKRKLIDLENNILRLLAESKGSLLDDVELVDTLQVSKITAEDVTQQLKVAEETEKKIDTAREGYRSAAVRSSITYFVLDDMSKVDPMYQYSLDSYVDLFVKNIEDSRSMMNSSSNEISLAERVKVINDYHTLSVYKSTCIGLFERHKLLFSLQLCFNIMKQRGEIPPREFSFFGQVGSIVDMNKQEPNVHAGWLSDKAWTNLNELDSLCSGVKASFEMFAEDWKNWYTSEKPEETTLPEDWDVNLSDLQKICLIRALRPDRVIFAASIFVSKNLGAAFADPPTFDLAEIYQKSTSKTPLIFVLSPGVDPTDQVQTLARTMSRHLFQVALGQGQAPVAVKAIEDAQKDGSWVLLANCHLMLSWMPDLESLVEESCESSETHGNFRLWLSSSPDPKFPLTLLQRGIKMTTEPPRGLRPNMKKMYNLITEEKFAECQQQTKYKKLLFTLCWFHSVLLERRKFKSLGYNIPYEFNDSDYLICHDLVIVFLDENPEKTPFEAMRYLIGEANYGGRVTDSWDRRLVNVYMSQFFCEDAINKDKFFLSELPDYFIPPDGNLEDYREFIEHLPHNDHPAAFGQHPNADISSQIEQTNELLETIISLQPGAVAVDGTTPEEAVAKQIDSMNDKVPELFDIAVIQESISARPDPDALKTVLYQEMSRYNILIGHVKKSLQDLRKAVTGFATITPDLEDIMTALLEYKVPRSWAMAYPSTKPLGSWINDLQIRIGQIRSWVDDGIPSVFWLSGFTYPSGFLTAVLQTMARTKGVAIDTLSWEFPVVEKNGDEITGGPKDGGVYVSGLYLEGARWDYSENQLAESLPMELMSPMPILHFRPAEGKKKVHRSMYECPLYMYPVRTGTRERPSFVLSVDLKSGTHTDDHWTKRGVALLLSTSE